MTLQHHWRTEKIKTLAQAVELAAMSKQQNKRVVTVNGSFDLLHAGHLDMLEEAKQQGDVLFVGLNSDRSIRQAKGPARPYISEKERAALLAALICVDYVVIVDENYDEVPQQLITAIKPDIHVNGAEYGLPQDWVEWPAMKAVGAQGHAVIRRPGLATSDIVKKIKST